MKTYDFIDTSAFDALKKVQEQFDNSAFAVTMRNVQKMLDAMVLPDITSTAQAMANSFAPILDTVERINNLYAPILEQTREYEALYNNAMVSALKNSLPAITAMSNVDFSVAKSIAESLSLYSSLSESIVGNIDFENVSELYTSGTITDEDVAQEFDEIVKNKKISFDISWDNIKKSKWFLAFRLILVILAFLGSPVVEKVKDNTLEVLGINEFWEESGVYEILDSLYGIETQGSTVTEEEAKLSIDKSKTGNVSKQKREDLLAKIKEIRTFISSAPQDENTGNLLTYLSEIEKDVNGKKYGLVFEEHREDIDEVLDTHTPVLTENEDLFIENCGQINFLIEGDNLASLKLLEKTHKGKIDLICIDPPYNRGKKDFKYDDDYIELSDTFRHSKWLSFMDKRLRLMYSLLSPSGVIIINIDEHELATLSTLCQMIFTDDNVDYMIWQKTDSKVDRNTNAKIIHRFKSVHENVIICYKNKSNTFFNKMMRLPEWKNKQSNPDKDPRGPWSSGIISFEEGHKNEDKNSPNYYTITTPSGKQYTRHWFVDKEEFARLQKDNRIAFPKGGDGVPRLKTFENEEKEYFMDSILRGVGTSSSAKDELFDIFGDREIFDTPKPIKLIQELIRVSTLKNSTILDVFAGSGTTGHAVMKLNAEDGGNRRFILCTNNENNICRDVTYERIKHVIDKEGYAASLKYYRVDYIPVSERMYYEYADELLLHIRELVELENGVNFTDNAEIGIVLTEEELDEFIANTDAFAKCRKLYMGHDLLPSDEQERILNSKGIEISIIPDYYYRDLQEG